MSPPITVLAIDGGGIRGIIPALVLAEIERRTGSAIADLFDLIAGTSTGGVLALGLVKPGPDGTPAYRADDLLALYEEEGHLIFSRSIWRRLQTIESTLEEKYDTRPLEALLERYFGDTRLNAALVDVLISCYEIERRIPWFFKRSHAEKKGGDWNPPMKQIARATSAAPTYFQPLQVPVQGERDYYALIDGGVYANNPALCAYVEARRLFPDAHDVLVVSLGTGSLTRRLPFDEAVGWGLLGWARSILSVVFDGVSSTVDYQLRELLPCKHGEPRYYRFQTVLDQGSDDMDDVSALNLRALRLHGEAIITRQSEELERLCGQLVAARATALRTPALTGAAAR
ncbi:MAG: patatin-like phospholipase family protein [Thermomicrobiales bacterium]